MAFTDACRQTFAHAAASISYAKRGAFTWAYQSATTLGAFFVAGAGLVIGHPIHLNDVLDGAVQLCSAYLIALIGYFSLRFFYVFLGVNRLVCFLRKSRMPLPVMLMWIGGITTLLCINIIGLGAIWFFATRIDNKPITREVVREITHEVIRETKPQTIVKEIQPQTIVKETPPQFSEAEKSSILKEVNINRLSREIEAITRGKDECSILFDKNQTLLTKLRDGERNAAAHGVFMTAGMAGNRDRQMQASRDELDTCIVKYLGSKSGAYSTKIDLDNAFSQEISRRKYELDSLMSH